MISFRGLVLVLPAPCRSRLPNYRGSIASITPSFLGGLSGGLEPARNRLCRPNQRSPGGRLRAPRRGGEPPEIGRVRGSANASAASSATGSRSGTTARRCEGVSAPAPCRRPSSRRRPRRAGRRAGPRRRTSRGPPCGRWRRAHVNDEPSGFHPVRPSGDAGLRGVERFAGAETRRLGHLTRTLLDEGTLVDDARDVHLQRPPVCGAGPLGQIRERARRRSCRCSEVPSSGRRDVRGLATGPRRRPRGRRSSRPRRVLRRCRPCVGCPLRSKSAVQ